MKMTMSQLLLSTIILFVIYKTYGAYRRKNLSERFIFVWITFWVGVLILVFQQDFVITLAQSVGISRGVDLVIYVSLIVLFYLIYKILVYLNELDRKITHIVRKIALKDKRSK